MYNSKPHQEHDLGLLQGARKLSQNSSEQDIAGVREGLTTSPDQLDNQLAAHMRQL